MLLNRLRNVSAATGFSAGIYVNSDGCTFPPITLHQRRLPDTIVDVDNERAMDSASRRLAENNLLMKSLPANVVKTLEAKSISKTELNVAVNHLIGNLNNLIPGPGLSAHGLSNIMNNVYSIFLQSNIVDQECYHHILHTIHQTTINNSHNNSAHNDEYNSLVNLDSEQDTVETAKKSKQKRPVIETPWNKFKNDPRTDRICVICQDVLACPQILNCGHSFCGICLHNYKENCVSSDVEVCHNCPRCREQITQVTFQKAFDAELQYKINELPDCPEKDDWKQRNDQFDELNCGTFIQQRVSRFEDCNDDEEEDYFYQLVDLSSKIVVYVATAAIMLIVLWRYFPKK